MEEHIEYLKSIYQDRGEFLAVLGMEIEYLYMDVEHRILNKIV